jgi:hypothetical protein
VAVGFAGAALGGGFGVAVDHLAGLPAGQAHEVAFIAAGGEPGVGEGVAELVGVQAGEADARAAVGDDLEQAGGVMAPARPIHRLGRYAKVWLARRRR